jgi:hypothetical protein
VFPLTRTLTPPALYPCPYSYRRVQTSINNITDAQLGECGEFEEKGMGDERCVANCRVTAWPTLHSVTNTYRHLTAV